MHREGSPLERQKQGRLNDGLCRLNDLETSNRNNYQREQVHAVTQMPLLVLATGENRSWLAARDVATARESERASSHHGRQQQAAAVHCTRALHSFACVLPAAPDLTFQVKVLVHAQFRHSL
ncbi:hypothetical protein GUJ93_ZPchr0007g6002 [Zizania palustris]|uniref:Uncharacterized protein n=1 Tax=Zizania palustris TaxID=103762 RepID=A0A8J5T7Z6_ZIZPA|nr:hypothetical protein GUJ93_ZPchr0007g6002 [Zizania palustris]